MARGVIDMNIRFKAALAGALAIFTAYIGLSAPVFAQAGNITGDFPKIYTMSPLGVNLQTGRSKTDVRDIEIGPLHYDRGGGGFEHSAILNWRTSGNATEVVASVGDQRMVFHVSGVNGTYVPIDSGNIGWKLVKVGSQHKLTNKSGTIYTLESHPARTGPLPGFPPHIVKQADLANGQRFTFTYNASGYFTKVTSNLGYALVFDFGSNGQLSSICGFNMAVTQVTTSTTCAGAALKVSYSTVQSGNTTVTSVTDLAGNVVTDTYTSTSTGWTNCESLPNSATCAILTEGGPASSPSSTGMQYVMVGKQTSVDGTVWNYQYDFPDLNGDDPPPYLGEIRNTTSSVSSPLSGATAVYGNGYINMLTTEAGITTYEYTGTYPYVVYNSNNMPTQQQFISVFPSRIIYPEGNSVYYSRDFADNTTSKAEIAKPGSGLAGLVTIWTYPTANLWASPTICAVTDKLCDKPTKITDPNGKATDYTYSTVHGGMLTKTEPAATNGIRPQTRYTYTARYGRDVNGTALSPPVYVLTAEEYCKTTAASGSGCAGGAADEVVTAYDYGPTTGPNNLLLRGTVADSGGLNLRTCYKYDQYGRKVAETQPLGTGSTCP